jgi:hypothetical protein
MGVNFVRLNKHIHTEIEVIKRKDSYENSRIRVDYTILIQAGNRGTKWTPLATFPTSIREEVYSKLARNTDYFRQGFW